MAHAVTGQDPLTLDLLKALGMSTEDMVTSIDIRVRCDRMVEVDVVRLVREDQLKDLVEVLGKYQMVPRAEEPEQA